ncbi:NFX1-type zinc finger-containing protein 1-like [Thrips palmi]|uniref:NFX1-type zinc finger-containing protein 1-like n=1 Tax=Thrips palmi TaxID=161013 RepID=A0A6P8Z0K0_THRPL|nr:NFX1-type zinc finger-containing protein 1-like [Thrips palmi]
MTDNGRDNWRRRAPSQDNWRARANIDDAQLPVPQRQRPARNERPSRLPPRRTGTPSSPSTPETPPPLLTTAAGHLEGQEAAKPREIFLGYKKLEELAKDDGVTIMEKLSNEAMLTAFHKLTSGNKIPDDWIRLVVAILARVCRVEYQPLVLRLFHRLCQKEFLEQLLLHIVQLGMDSDRKRRDGVGDFLANFCELSSGILRLIPVLACEKLENLVKKAASEASDLRPFEGSEHVLKELENIKAKIKAEKERLENSRPAVRPARDSSFLLGPPPEDFRELPVFPTVEDLTLLHRPYLRANKVQGAYDDANHYLDVQFRLLREDFIRPLRDGIREYCEKVAELGPSGSKNRFKINNVRVYEKVKILGVKTEEERIGLDLAFDPDLKLAARVNWEYSKRLMQDTLLVLTRDASFASVTLLTVCKRDLTELQAGRVLVQLCEGAVSEDLFLGHFIMVECSVFFGAYCHALKALQTFDEDSIPLKDYIVYASNAREMPPYQARAIGTYLYLPLASSDPASMTETWPVRLGDRDVSLPSSSDMGLDDSQYRALVAAVHNKLMLVQGPPGTGKTFLGLKVAACLLHNKALWTATARPRPMLIVCYTNHALDQFLSGLLPATQSIVRVGGGCKDPKIEPFRIHNLKRTFRPQGDQRHLYQRIREQRAKFNMVKNLSDRLRYCHSMLYDCAGILSHETLKNYGIITRAEYDYFRAHPIFQWLCGDLYEVARELGDSFEAVVLHAGLLDFECVDGAEVVHQLRNDIQFSFSCPMVQAKINELEEEDKLDNLFHLRHLLSRVKRLLENPLPSSENIVHAPLHNLNNVQRWQLYRMWQDRLRTQFVKPVLDRMNVEYSAAASLLQQWKMVEDQTIMANNLVIGMTTSYAASHQSILKELKPRIVIVEEAAEVLEAHVLVSLAGDVEHLVMIGDHQQLRPNPAVYELARRYHLDVSLFERLINNGVHCVALTTQHRMRPEIARLISPSIYPNLINHPSVRNFPSVRGVTKNVFFLNHTRREEEVKDAQSFQNSHEANMVSGLVKYLLQQGYDPSKITVLSTYKGQQFYFSKLHREGDQTHLKNIRNTVVDNYQGEECDIILLSLVRSNSESKVGFVETDNRVCVALSRARHGKYGESLGDALPLRCEIHGTVTLVSAAEDFANCPQGGCTKLCGTMMPCGHPCNQVCHTQDRDHKTARCMERCLKDACNVGHRCPDRCCEPCQPCIIPKHEELPCGHTARMACHMDPLTYKCLTKVTVTLPACRHEREASCYQTAHLDKLPCKVPCNVRMGCGHTCGKNCHVLDDPEHEKVKCLKPCGQKKISCSMDHPCKKMCYEKCEECVTMVEKTLGCGHKYKMMCKDDAASKECGHKCARSLPCGHKCPMLCREPCAPCRTPVKKTVPACMHEQLMECGMDPALFKDCGAPCRRFLTGCGHRCALKCRDLCSEALCTEPVFYRKAAACGHKIKVPCNMASTLAPDSQDLLLHCQAPCGQLLLCEHACSGTCGSCLQGRFHATCTAKCERPLICGHLCKEPCAVSCPPCNQPCSVECAHSVCKSRCGEPCMPCQEPCMRNCIHRKCGVSCGSICPEEPCSLPCSKTVEKCGHNCVGLCGDTCLCKECNKDKFEIFFGREDEEDARFIILPDCQHIFESWGLDNWMLADGDGDGEIILKVCPMCKTPVLKSQRYSNVVKRKAFDVSKVKSKVYGNWATIQPATENALRALNEVLPFPNGFEAASHLVTTIESMLQNVKKDFPDPKNLTGTRKKPSRSWTEIRNVEQFSVILKNLSKIVADAFYQPASQLLKLSNSGQVEIQLFVETLCRNISARNLVRMSAQEASDVNTELLRLQRLAFLCQVENGSGASRFTAGEREMLYSVSNIIRSIRPYAKEQDALIKTMLVNLAEKASVSITKAEIQAVVAAMGMGQGHWYQCPNGHPYCITECGGAMQEGHCNECGAPIGGRDHRLRSDNRLATNIDGATRPAWPTAMNYGY